MKCAEKKRVIASGERLRFQCVFAHSVGNFLREKKIMVATLGEKERVKTTI